MTKYFKYSHLDANKIIVWKQKKKKIITRIKAEHKQSENQRLKKIIMQIMQDTGILLIL